MKSINKRSMLSTLTAIALSGSILISNSLIVANAMTKQQRNEPQLSYKNVQHLTDHAMPKAKNVNDLKISEFTLGTKEGKYKGKVIRTTSVYTFRVKGDSKKIQLFAADDSPLGKQLHKYYLHHHKYFKQN